MRTQVVIVGAGLAGLHAASLLQSRGVGFLLLEARTRLGGRILSVDRTERVGEGFDLGPSWFWPEVQPLMSALVERLGLQTFPQHRDGDALSERTLREKPRRYPAERPAFTAWRIQGGTAALLPGLAADLPAESILLGQRMIRAELSEGTVTITVCDSSGQESTIQAQQVLAALPPRLLESGVRFAPDIDAVSAQIWRSTATWMAPHAKFFAIYDRPFWREDGLSGAVQSAEGPLSEIHDATTGPGSAALFGFLGIGADQRRRMGQEVVTQACLDQLIRLFGPEAQHPRATLFKDWAWDDLTATDVDRIRPDHPKAESIEWIQGPWRPHLTLAGSETSPVDPGYLEGALDASIRGVEEVLEKLQTKKKGWGS